MNVSAKIKVLVMLMRVNLLFLLNGFLDCIVACFDTLKRRKEKKKMFEK